MPVGRATAETYPEVTDEELCALALAADPDAEVDDDAVSIWDLAQSGSDRPLPEWYMPAPMGGGRLVSGWHRIPVALIIASFLAINAFGLCNTYGQLGFS